MANNPDSLTDSAARAHLAGRFDEAESSSEKALAINPKDADALLILGMARIRKENLSGALEAFRAIVDVNASSYDGQFWTSVTLRKIGWPLDALKAARLAVNIDGRNEHALNQLGMCLLDLDLSLEAAEVFSRAIAINPKLAPLYDNLGRALQLEGRNKEALAAFKRAIEIAPASPAVQLRYGEASMMEGDLEVALRCAQTILQKDPQSVQANLLMARTLIADGKVEEGAKFAKRSANYSSGGAVPTAYYGQALQSLGKIDEADEQFRRSIAADPRQGAAYRLLVHNHRVTEAERPLVEQMEELARDPGMPRRDVMQIQNGLGKAKEDLREYESAMAHFDEANQIDHELKGAVFDKEQIAETVSLLIEKFDTEFVDRHRSIGSDSQVPTFVVGMMRSGTTLAEQILSSHRQVGGVGEQLFWQDHAGSTHKLFSGKDGEPDTVKMRSLSTAYVELLEKLAPGHERVVDKMNTNYMLLGLLHTLYPNARIVNMLRHPVDNCISIWATLLANGIDLGADKSNVVFAYRQYERIMAHWRTVIPADRLMDVRYEELVSEQNLVTRRMIEFCGLPWDDACLKPEENLRSVTTPSVWQVRQPVYKTSTERWRKFESCLGAFADLLQD